MLRWKNSYALGAKVKPLRDLPRTQVYKCFGNKYYQKWKDVVSMSDQRSSGLAYAPTKEAESQFTKSTPKILIASSGMENVGQAVKIVYPGSEAGKLLTGIMSAACQKNAQNNSCNLSGVPKALLFAISDLKLV